MFEHGGERMNCFDNYEMFLIISSSFMAGVVIIYIITNIFIKRYLRKNTEAKE